jgi:hypothetical protein
MNYQSKYLKYKQKYLNLKNEILIGSGFLEENDRVFYNKSIRIILNNLSIIQSFKKEKDEFNKQNKEAKENESKILKENQRIASENLTAEKEAKQIISTSTNATKEKAEAEAKIKTINASNKERELLYTAAKTRVNNINANFDKFKKDLPIKYATVVDESNILYSLTNSIKDKATEKKNITEKIKSQDDKTTQIIKDCSEILKIVEPNLRALEKFKPLLIKLRDNQDKYDELRVNLAYIEI